MPAIRLIVQSTVTDADARTNDLVRFSLQVREEPGCIQAEDFRGTEFGENLLHLELWESPAAFDSHWQKALQSSPGAMDELLSLQAPNHYGTPEAPRRTGQSGIEFYEHRYFARLGTIWGPADETTRPESIRWPAWTALRLLIQNTSDPATDPAPQVQNSLETREEKGCDQFEHFRGIEYPENTVLMETWSSPEIYDIHWLNRLLQQRARAAAGGQAVPQAPPFQRRYGSPGFEWYHHCYFTLLKDVWVPEDPAKRMVTVRW